MDPVITPPPDSAPPRTSRGALLFCAVLVLVGIVYLGLAAKRLLFPPVRPVPMPAYDIGAEAQKYLRQSKPGPLSDKLSEVLDEAKRVHFDSQAHPLLGTVAPEFTRMDVDGHPWALKDALAKGPVVVVFYLGYHCNHCVSQLFDLNEDIERFRELGVEVVAISPDAPDVTKERYKKYGAFQFPVLQDRNNRIAESYGIYTPERDGKSDDLLHGTFVLDQKGVVKWAAFGEAPFGHNPTLLFELAKIKGIVK